MSTRVTVYFDLVSPYSYLALAEIDALGRRLRVTWRPRPVVYGVLLDRSGLVGPAEVAVKRRYTFADVRRAAALRGLPFVGPPTHPFRSLDALRAIASADTDEDAMHLAVRLGDACWGRGADLADAAVVAAELVACGVPADRAGARITSPEAKERLRAHTDEALAAGVFGVPTFRLGDELFWGHDRVDHLEARLNGRLADPLDDLEELLRRPRGADRNGAGAAS